MSGQDASLAFPEKKEEEITSVFLLEDILKEYNHRVASHNFSDQKKKKKVPLSLQPFKSSSNSSVMRPSLKESSDNPVIRPMTKEEINKMWSHNLQGDDWRLLKNILQDQVTPPGMTSNIPTIVQGVSLVEIVNELGLKGKVYYKTMGEKTYVILKGLAGERNILQGTRYLNTNPQIVQFGLAKVDVKTVFKSGFKTSIWIYGAIKAVEATEMLLQEGDLKVSFFSQVGADIPKIAITSVVTAAVAGTVAAAGIPVALGVGVVLVVGVAAGIALEYVDRKMGLTEKFNDAADKMWKNLKEHLHNHSKSQQKVNDWDPLYGLVFGGPFAHNQQVLRKGNYLVYSA